MKKLLLLALSISAGINSCSTKPTENLSLRPADFEQKAKSMSQAVIIDIRTPQEVKSAYIKGAINFDFNQPEFKILISGLDKKKSYFVYGNNDESCEKAAETMRDNGFEKVYTLEGGLKAWREAGLTTVAPK